MYIKVLEGFKKHYLQDMLLLKAEASSEKVLEKADSVVARHEI